MTFSSENKQLLLACHTLLFNFMEMPPPPSNIILPQKEALHVTSTAEQRKSSHCNAAPLGYSVEWLLVDTGVGAFIFLLI
jgi:hypothetical protein